MHLGLSAVDDCAIGEEPNQILQNPTIAKKLRHQLVCSFYRIISQCLFNKQLNRRAKKLYPLCATQSSFT